LIEYAATARLIHALIKHGSHRRRRDESIQFRRLCDGVVTCESGITSTPGMGAK